MDGSVEGRGGEGRWRGGEDFPARPNGPTYPPHVHPHTMPVTGSDSYPACLRKGLPSRTSYRCMVRAAVYTLL